ncbi:endonuclease domain-containing protein [Robertkochia sediminum]|uniref:endonuclease domain-containing protein n=1 Tax=Robertkochia sediminum TaxID=2785326 RepID=UPI0019342FB3|nr:endonuclease domain-containing protein [Robertkochia sediminum]MBL7474005.1 DUF559 domain-containing protein [Robertkochia sediminum]
MGSHYNRKSQKKFRQELRKQSTFYENLFWDRLQGKKLKGRKFRRQAGFGKYIADFYCPSEKIIIELDGPYHSTEDRTLEDQKRDLFFEKSGITVIRISNPIDREAFEKALDLISSHFSDD